MRYKRGRDELDPLAFLSRHQMPAIGNDDTEKVLKVVVTTEHTGLERKQVKKEHCGSRVKPSKEGTGKAAKETQT